MKRRKYIIIAIIALTLTLIITNPTKDDYVEWTVEQLSEDNVGILSLFSRPIIRNMTTHKNYGLLSIYETKYDENSRTVAIGVFNNFVVIKQA